jgi:hypothetical protein
MLPRAAAQLVRWTTGSEGIRCPSAIPTSWRAGARLGPRVAARALPNRALAMGCLGIHTMNEQTHSGRHTHLSQLTAYRCALACFQCGYGYLRCWLLGALVAASLGGCSHTCTSAAVVGRYIMRSGPDVYELNLRKDGTGSLSRNGVPEAFTWVWWAESEQAFLHVSVATIDDLNAHAGSPFTIGAVMARAGNPTPRADPKTQRGDLGLISECSAGLASELDIGLPSNHLRFARTDR